jgi:ubiquinone/menaquinone biosynthesis C-methylase UbiE
MDNRNYYEAYDWSAVHRKKLEPLIAAINGIVPENVKSIIDIGCGNGVITSELGKSYTVLGVDRSEAALALLSTNKLLASCDNIPVEDNSFDLVLSTELLEHLEEEVFQKTLDEFTRISRRYILITVPNNENLHKYLLKCPGCGYVFNRSYHMRTFSKKMLVNLLPGYKALVHKTLGAKVRYYNHCLSNLKSRFTPSHSWIPAFWTPEGKRKSMCPLCEQTFEYPYRFNIIALTCDLTNVVISRKKPYWQMVLFEKDNTT